MSEVAALIVKLYGEKIGTLALIPGEKSIFGFTDDYIENENRPVLGLAFKDLYGQPKTEFRPYGPAVMPFFSNLLPEDHLRKKKHRQPKLNTPMLPTIDSSLNTHCGSHLPGFK